MCIKDFPTPLDMSVRFLSLLGLSANYEPLPLLILTDNSTPNQGALHIKLQVDTTKHAPLCNTEKNGVSYQSVVQDNAATHQPISQQREILAETCSITLLKPKKICDSIL